METRTAQKTRKTLRKNDHAGDRGRHKEEELSMGDEEPGRTKWSCKTRRPAEARRQIRHMYGSKGEHRKR